MTIIQGNPYSEIREVFHFQGSLNNVVPSVYTSDVHTVKNADELQFFITTLNQVFGIELRWVDTAGLPIRDAAGSLLPQIVIVPANSSSPQLGGRQTRTANVVVPQYGNFFQLIVTYRADTPYIAPQPVWTGVANLYNSAMIVKDENAPLLKVNLQLVNPKQ